MFFISSSQQSIYVTWYVKTTQDIADTYIYIRDEKNELHYTNTIAYNLRTLTIAIDNELKMSLQKGGNFDICIQAKTSNGFGRKWYKSQCQAMPNDFSKWPKKFNPNKRNNRRNKIKLVNSVLGLVSDSILITLCIFLGVCFRRLNDVEL